jgi:endonuclease YncB( thermonuclease family)
MTFINIERARRKRALSFLRHGLVLGWLVCAALSPIPAAADIRCSADHIDQHVHVRYAYDGDTVTLEDGRRLRLIGIDTPELGRNGKPDQAFAVVARDAVRGLLEESPELGLRFDRTHRDVHDRLLAHAFLPDGTSLSAWLLERGYATLLIIPPNDWNAVCYEAAERRARNDGAGIWALPAYRPIISTHLQKTARGYRMIKGRITHIGESAHSIWLDMEGKVAARIDRKDLDYFSAIPLRRLLNKNVIVRGWVYPYHDEMQLRLRYSADLEVLDSLQNGIQ